LRRNTAQRAGKFCEEDHSENYNNSCSKTILAGQGRVSRILGEWEEGWGKSFTVWDLHENGHM
jgi:hypothetical protein